MLVEENVNINISLEFELLVCIITAISRTHCVIQNERTNTLISVQLVTKCVCNLNVLKVPLEYSF